MGDTSKLNIVDTCAQADCDCENVKREILIIIIIIPAWKGRRKIGKKYFLINNHCRENLSQLKQMEKI